LPQWLVAVPALFAVSIMPGLCMTLAMTMGMTVGVRRALWMMIGELAGIGLVATMSIVGIAAVTTAHPEAYRWARYLGGAYLGYIGLRLWLAGGQGAAEEGPGRVQPVAWHALVRQGFVSAVANPKAWVLYVSLLPPFIDPGQPFIRQIVTLIAVMLVIEFACLLFYASGGHALKALLRTGGLRRAIHLLAGGAIVFVAGNLILSG
jgi:homoserine/homoserine lactone efflux protein